MRAAWLAYSRIVRRINALGGLVGGGLIVVSCVAISYEVFSRYYLKAPHTWSLEFNIFLLVAATFLAAGYTQMRRGHVGTEVLETVMSARWNRLRILAGDILSFLLCVFLAVKVSEYAWEAWNEGWTTDSVWAPHLWIPYSLMGLGLVLISAEYVVQIVDAVRGGHVPRSTDEP